MGLSLSKRFTGQVNQNLMNWLPIGVQLEKEMATHSSVLAWRIPWVEGPGGLQSIGLQRVRHD